MKLLMISGDRSILEGKQGAFWYALQEQRKHWERIDIICPRPGSSQIQLFEGSHHHVGKNHEGGEVFFHPCPSGLWYQITWILKKGLQLYKEQAFDVISVHDYPPFYNGIGARRLAKKTNVPFVLEIHHIVGWPHAASWSELIGKIMTRIYLPYAVGKAAAIRTVSKATKQKLLQWWLPSSKIHVVPSFYLDRELLTADVSPPEAYDVSCCGRLVPNKGLSEVIHAIASIPSARLLVIGDGPRRPYYEQLAADLKMSNRVTFLGWLPTLEGVIGAIQTARMFVMNSKSEGGPRSALEAMACGMPVIVTPVGVMPDVIEDGKNGMFTNGSAEDLAQKISLLMNNEQKRDQLGKEARKILDIFERSTLVKKYADFLKSFA